MQKKLELQLVYTFGTAFPALFNLITEVVFFKVILFVYGLPAHSAHGIPNQIVRFSNITIVIVSL